MTTVVTARRVIDGTGRVPIEDGAVLVDGDRIAAVGRRAEIPVPDGAQLIDCGNQTVLPAFVDAHSHASLIPGLGDQDGQQMEPVNRRLLRAASCLRIDLKSGVTTMRVMGEEHFIDVDLRTAIAAGQIPDAMHGLMWWEIATVVGWGASPHDAILAATRWAAEAIGMEREVGSLQPGKLAHLISVEGDPLRDAASLQRIGLILQGGRRRDTLSVE